MDPKSGMKWIEINDKLTRIVTIWIGMDANRTKIDKNRHFTPK